jgi:hypothetical protein
MVSPVRVGARDYKPIKRAINGASYFSTTQIAPNSWYIHFEKAHLRVVAGADKRQDTIWTASLSHWQLLGVIRRLSHQMTFA